MNSDDEYRAMVERLWPRLVRAARLLGSNAQDAEDLAQSTLVQVYLAWAKVSTASDPSAYVYRMLFNSRLTSMRRHRWRREVLTDEFRDSPGVDAISQLHLAEVLLAALRKLPVKHREVLVLRYYLDLTEPQVAEVLDVPLGTIKSRLHRAQVQLQADPSLARTPESETS